MNKQIPKKVVATFTSVATVAMLTAGACLPMAAGAFYSLAHQYEVGHQPWGIRLGDVNGDSKMDMVVAVSNAGVNSVLLVNGDGTFSAQSDYPVRYYSTYLDLGDINGDNALDIVSNGHYVVSTFANNGDGTFAPRVDYTIDGVPLVTELSM